MERPAYLRPNVQECVLTATIRLMKEASINAKQAGERGISAKSVKKVTEVKINSPVLYYHANRGLIDVSVEIQGLSGVWTDVHMGTSALKDTAKRPSHSPEIRHSSWFQASRK
jgi:hypothetical protein